MFCVADVEQGNVRWEVKTILPFIPGCAFSLLILFIFRRAFSSSLSREDCGEIGTCVLPGSTGNDFERFGRG